MRWKWGLILCRRILGLFLVCVFFWFFCVFVFCVFVFWFFCVLIFCVLIFCFDFFCVLILGFDFVFDFVVEFVFDFVFDFFVDNLTLLFFHFTFIFFFFSQQIGICTILGWYFQTEARKYHSAPVQYTLSPWFFFEKKGGGGGERGVEMMSFAEGEGVVVNFGEEEEKERDKRKGITYEFDWTGLGDWFFLPAGVAYAVGSYVCIYSPSMEACLGVQLLGAVGYLLDAIFYYPGLVKEEEEEGGGRRGRGRGRGVCVCEKGRGGGGW